MCLIEHVNMFVNGYKLIQYFLHMLLSTTSIFESFCAHFAGSKAAQIDVYFVCGNPTLIVTVGGMGVDGIPTCL